jgi:hypothetical protein
MVRTVPLGGEWLWCGVTWEGVGMETMVIAVPVLGPVEKEVSHL